METAMNGHDIEVNTQLDPMLASFHGYQATGGTLNFTEWSTGRPVIAEAVPRMAPRAKRKLKLKSNPSTASAADVKASKRRIASRAESAANGQHRPSEEDSIALAAGHVAAEREWRGKVRDAIKLFETSATKREAAEMCARYFGVGTVNGYTRPLWVAEYKTQREAVAAMWRVPVTPENKPTIDAKVMLMSRLRADGYKLLKIAPPVPAKPPEPAPIVDRATTAARRFLLKMQANERTEYLARIAQAIKAIAKDEKTAAAAAAAAPASN
jgi:hypothetical protein